MLPLIGPLRRMCSMEYGVQALFAGDEAKIRSLHLGRFSFDCRPSAFSFFFFDPSHGYLVAGSTAQAALNGGEPNLCSGDTERANSSLFLRVGKFPLARSPVSVPWLGKWIPLQVKHS